MNLHLIDNRLNQLHNEPMSEEEWRESEYRRVESRSADMEKSQPGQSGNGDDSPAA